QCGKDGVFTIVVFRNATVPGLVLESLRVSRGQDPACAPLLTTPESVTFRFPMVACGAQARFMDGAVVYSVNIEADKTILKGRKGSITRDRTFKLTVQCNFTLMGSTELHVKTQKQQPGEQAVLKGEGPLQLDLRLAKDAAYTSYYAPLDHPVVRVLQQPVFVEVRVLNREDPDLVLLLDNCWASTSDDPDDGLRWDLLEKGCPFSGDDYQTILQAVLAAPGVSFPNHYKRFQITMFTFVDSPSPQTFHGLVGSSCILGCDFIFVPSPFFRSDSSVFE
ncbi:ZP4 protein, partial [Amia calva]|nr:ZP4 protein [Amia calva]